MKSVSARISIRNLVVGTNFQVVKMYIVLWEAVGDCELGYRIMRSCIGRASI